MLRGVTTQALGGRGLGLQAPPGTPGALAPRAPAPGDGSGPPAALQPGPHWLNRLFSGWWFGFFIPSEEVCFEQLIDVKALVWAPAKESFSVFLGSSLKPPGLRFDLLCSFHFHEI